MRYFIFGLLGWLAFSASAQVPPVNRNPFSTNIPPGFIISGNTLIFTNNTAGAGGWIQFDTTGLKVFDLKGQEAGRIYLNSSSIAMEYGAGFSGLFTNGTMVIHTRDGTKVPVQIEGDFTSQTTFLIQAWTNSGTAQNTFTVDSGGTIYSRSLTANRGVFTDSNTNLISATTNGIAYAANTNTINFASNQQYLMTTITNDTVFTNQNQQAGRVISVKLTGNITNSNLTFPAGWQFLGAGAPGSLASNKVAILSLTAYGTDPTNIVAAYAAQP